MNKIKEVNMKSLIMKNRKVLKIDQLNIRINRDKWLKDLENQIDIKRQKKIDLTIYTLENF